MFSIWLKAFNPPFSIWLKELNMTQSIEPSFSIWVNESNPLFHYDSKNWTFFEHESQKLFWIITQRIEPSVNNWLEDLNFYFFTNVSKNSNFLEKEKRWFEELIFRKISIKILNFFDDSIFCWKKKNMTHRTEPLFSNMTHRNWTFLFNMTLTHIWLKDLNLFLSMSQRIELCSWQELNFFQIDSKILLNRTQRIELFFFFWRWPKEPNFFFRYVLRIVFQKIHRIELVFQHYLKNGTFESLTQRIELSLIWLKELNFSWNITWHKELNLLWNKILLKELKLLFYMTQRIELFFLLFKALIFFFAQRIEPFLSRTRSKELNPFSRIWLKELNPSYMTQRLENLS